MQNVKQANYTLGFTAGGSSPLAYIVGPLLLFAIYAGVCICIPTGANHLSSLLLGVAVLVISKKDWRYGAVSAAGGMLIYVLFAVEPRYSLVISDHVERITVCGMVLFLAGLIFVDFRKQSNPDTDAARQRTALREALLLAIRLKQFTLHYQPIVNAEGTVVAQEALLRWTHPSFSSMSPGLFLPVIEEIDAMRELERWIVQTACADAMQWEEPLRVQVNISPESVSPGMLEWVRHSLSTSGLPASRLVLEIVETSLLKDADATILLMQEFRNVGVSLAIDDFGAGFASLQYLVRFPFDQVKLDRSFIQELQSKPQNRIITHYVIAMAREMNLVVTAEGIETHEQRDWLVEHGVPQMQGYLFGRPAAQEQVLQSKFTVCAPVQEQLQLDVLAAA